jgi:hypothetical protein
MNSLASGDHGDTPLKFTIENKVFEAFPGMKLVVVIARDVDNHQDKPGIRRALAEAWALAGTAATAYGNPQSHPRIKTWVAHFKALGVSRKVYPSSLEAMVRNGPYLAPGSYKQRKTYLKSLQLLVSYKNNFLNFAGGVRYK